MLLSDRPVNGYRGRSLLPFGIRLAVGAQHDMESHDPPLLSLSGDCQQGGQECVNQCTTVNSQECSTGGAASEICTTVNEQKCEIRYETVYEQVCDSAPSAPACTTVTEQQCTTVSEPVCTTVNEEQCSTTYGSQNEQECKTVLEQKCETEYMIKYEEKCTTVR